MILIVKFEPGLSLAVAVIDAIEGISRHEVRVAVYDHRDPRENLYYLRL